MTTNFEFSRRKRNRPSYVCVPCKTRKVKCDKGRPCNSCVTNKLEEYCHYENHNESSKEPEPPNSVSVSPYQTHSSEQNTQPALLAGTANSETSGMVQISQSELEALKIAAAAAAAGTSEVDRQKLLPRQEHHFSNSSKTYYNRTIRPMRQEWLMLHDPTAPGITSFATFMLFKNDMMNFAQANLRGLIKSDNPFIIVDQYVGVNPYVDDDEVIDMISGAPSAISGKLGTAESLTFSWRSTIAKQPEFYALRNYVTSLRDCETTKRQRRPSAQIRPKAPTFDDKALAANQNIQETMDYRLLTLDLTNKGHVFSSETPLTEKIKTVLPTRAATYKLIAHFFRLYIPYFPFVNQDTFYVEIEKIIGRENGPDVKIDVTLSKRLDFAYLGMLLVIVRFSYLSLFVNVSKDQTLIPCNEIPPEDFAYFVKNPIDVTAIELARECLTQFQKKKKISLEVLQCGMFLWTYSLFSPDEAEGADGGEYITLHGQLVSMAYSLGLHRDPDNVGCASYSESKKNIGRRIWYFLAILDFTSCFTTGHSLLINDLYSDTKCPSHVRGSLNVRDLEMEEAVNVIFHYADVLIKGPMNVVIKNLLQPSTDVNVAVLTMNLNVLELGIFALFGKTVDYLQTLEYSKPSYQYSKIMKARIAYGLKSFFMLMYLHLQMHYESRGQYEISFYYLKKLLWMGLNEIMPFFFPMIVKVKENFGDSAEKILNPQIQTTAQLCIELALVAIVKMNSQLYQLKVSPDHETRINNDHEYGVYCHMLKELVGSFEKCARAGLIALSMLSHRYYTAWGVSRSHNYLLKVVTSDDFYVHSYKHKILRRYTSTQLKELLEIVNSSLNILQTVAVRCEHVDLASMFNKRNPQASTSSSDVANNIPLSTNGDGNNEAKIFSQFEELNFDSGGEIDKLWLRILSERNQKDQDILQDTYRMGLDPLVNETLSYIPGSQRQNNFSEMPLGAYQDQPLPNSETFAMDQFDPRGQQGSDLDFSDLEILGVFSDFPLQHVFKG